MKKVVSLLLMLSLVLGATGCGAATPDPGKEPVGGNNGQPDTAVETPAEPSKEDPGKVDPPAAEVTLPEQVVFDQDGVKITVKSLELSDSFWGPTVKLLIENTRTDDVTVQVQNMSVNDIVVDPMMSCDVAAGKKANDEITLLQSTIEVAGIEVIKDIEFAFIIFNTDSFDTIVESSPIKLTTTADPSYVQKYDDSGFVAVEKDGVKIIVKKLNSEDSFWGADVYLYIDNTSAKNITVQVRDVSINGFMADPAFSADVPSGKKAFETMSFFESDLKDNGITDITTVEMVFHVFDMDSWDDIFNSEIITVNFE